MKNFLFLFLIFGLASCAYLAREDKIVLSPVAFQDLPGWSRDDLSGAVLALQKSVTKKCDWGDLCQQILQLNPQDTQKAYQFFESHFTPFAASNHGNKTGLFTGYYVPLLKGSLHQTATYHVPLYQVPDELVTIDLGNFREEWQGEQLVGRVQNKKIYPFYDRAEIEKGALAHAKKIVWVDDPVDAFFVQIQGSGIVEMEDGSRMKIGYAGKNGHEYVSIGKELVARGEMDLAQVSMQSIRDWLHAHPQQADEILHANPSYVFFRALDDQGVVGAQGVTLTAERSLAVDRKFVAYGTVMWVDIDHPDGGRIQKMMVAQDTGGAIKGPVRGDVFWGEGEKAADRAGRMRSEGQYYLLLPRQ